ncbi:MAG: endonuclease/exonuclease/phosphatase family protein [Prevotella sp.]|nr:endonuclease/exonuclease/phosphatase family protein [Prevotella sp.]
MFAAILLFILTFAELNCENLFDTFDNPEKADEEFTPDGIYNWTFQRYWRKITNIGKEILSCGREVDGSPTLADFIALTEVENDSVMFDLTRRSILRNAGYEYIITDGPDVRGINVALLYSPASFKPINHHSIRVKPLPKMRATRDILYVSGLIPDDDTLHIFVVHAPSRLGGEYKTRPNRQHVVKRLAEAVDSLRAISPEANIIIAGDFNDPPDGPSLEQLIERQLTDISAEAQGSNGAEGSYKFKDEWSTIDHVFVSAPLLPGADCIINDIDPLLVDDNTYGGRKPNRTFTGMRWTNGFSDHLPLVAHIRIKE